MNYQHVFQEAGHKNAALPLRGLAVLVCGFMGAILQKAGVPLADIATLLAIGMILLTLNIFWPQLYRKTIADLAEPSVEAEKTATRRAARA